MNCSARTRGILPCLPKALWSKFANSVRRSMITSGESKAPLLNVFNIGAYPMRPLIQEIVTSATPESLCEELFGVEGVVLLRTALFDDPRARYSFVTAQPFLSFRSFGSRCEIVSHFGRQTQFGNPWRLLDVLMSRYELLEEIDLPFPLGGCFGYWGYDLKNFVEPRLTRLAINDLELPDCQVGFYDSVIVFDHRLAKTWVVSTGLTEDGSR